jgi:hypothetical protein
MAESKSGGDSGFGFLIAFFGILFLMWSVNGGMSSANRNSDGSYKAPSTIEGISSEVNRISNETTELKKTTAESTAIGPLSSLNKYMALYQGGIGIDNPRDEYVTLHLASDAPSRVLITGMQIKSAPTGRGSTLPRAVYRPDFGRINYDDPVYLQPGDTAYITTGTSPVGYSFRVNKCTGYFNQSASFNPPLPYECPRASDEDLPTIGANYRNACLNYIESIGTCTMPLNDVPNDLGPECSSYVATKINYNTCVENHKLDADFYKPEWRLYLKQPENLWQNQRELVKVIDLSGNTAAYFKTY